MPQTFETQFGGRTLTIETGRLARLAGGSVTVRYGDTVVLGTANRAEPRPGLDFFPLTVDFEERMYAAGKIPGGFIKRESRPSEAAILAARLTDRPIRPLFPEGYKDDVQLVITVLSTDQENNPDILGTIASSAALTISEIPFQGPIGAVRVGRIGGEFVVNPTHSQLAESELDLIVSGTRDAIMMVEAGANLLPEDVMAEAILFGHRALQPVVDLQEQLHAAVGKPKRLPYLEPLTESVLDFVKLAAKKSKFVVVDVETTGRDPKMADLLEIGAVRIEDNKIVDRWSTLVDPGRSIIGNQMHGISDKEIKGAPSPKDAAEQFLKFAGDATLVGHNVGFDLGFLEEALGDGFRFQSGQYLDTLVLAREGYPDWAESYKLGDLARFFGIELKDAHRALPDAEATAQLAPELRGRPAEPPGDPRRGDRGIGAGEPDRRRRQGSARARPAPGARLEEPVRPRPQEDGPAARPERRHPNGRPWARRDPADHGRGRAAAPGPRVGPVHPGRHPGPDRGDPRTVLGRPADRHDRPGNVEALHPPLQHAAVQHRREQDDARTRPARDRPRPPRRAGAHPGPARPGRVPVRHPAGQRVRDLERVDLDGLNLRLDPRPDGRRRADQGSGRRRGDGPDLRAGRPLRGPHRHPRQGGFVR